jgi:hypothetical protein
MAHWPAGEAPSNVALVTGPRRRRPAVSRPVPPVERRVTHRPFGVSPARLRVPRVLAIDFGVGGMPAGQHQERDAAGPP